MRSRFRAPYVLNLTWFFMRTRPLRASATITAVVAGTLMVLTIALQSLALSGLQQAERAVGSADFVIETASQIRLGTSGALANQALIDEARSRGAQGARVAYKAFQLRPDRDPLSSIYFEEDDWLSRPFPGRFILSSGEWPAAPGEVAVSTATSARFPAGSVLSFFGGALTARVTGVVRDDFARSASFAIAARGTWDSASVLTPEQSARLDAAAIRVVYWRGSDAQPVVGALSAAISRVRPGEASGVDDLNARLVSRGSLEDRNRGNDLAATLALLLAPTAAGTMGSLFAARFVNRIRTTMSAIGVGRRRTRWIGVSSICVSAVGGAGVGVVLGALVGLSLRPALDSVTDRQIGPVHGLWETGVAALLFTVLGALFAILLLRRGRRAERPSIQRRVPVFAIVSPAAALALWFIGFSLAQGRSSFDQKLMAGMSIGVALVVVAPLGIGLLLRGSPRSMASLLAFRRLRRDHTTTQWVVVGVGSLIVVSFGLTTLFSSAVGTLNATAASEVAPGQLRFTPAIKPEVANRKLVSDVESALGISSPLTIAVADGAATIGDGTTIIVAGTADLERWIDRRLSAAERGALLAGGTLRTKKPTLPSVDFERADGSLTQVPAFDIRQIDPSFTNFDGFILAETAAALNIVSTTRFSVYTGLTPQQERLGRQVAKRVGFNPDWVSTYRAPDPFTESAASRLSGASLALMGGLLMAFYASSSTRSLRPTLASLRAIGVGRSWLSVTVVVQTATVLATALVTAILGAILGVLFLIRISGFTLDLYLPWQSIGLTFGGTVIGAVIGITLAVRRLQPMERMNQ